MVGQVLVKTHFGELIFEFDSDSIEGVSSVSDRQEQILATGAGGVVLMLECHVSNNLQVLRAVGVHDREEIFGGF